MVKRAFIIGLVLLCIVSFATPAYCADGMIKKLGRGVCNIATCPLEIYLQISRVNNSDGPLAAATYGTLKGVYMTCVRAIVGVYETATFPIPAPKNYEPILKDPEFFFEDMSW